MNKLLHTSLPMMITSLSSFLMRYNSIYFLDYFRRTTKVGEFVVARSAVLMLVLVQMINTMTGSVGIFMNMTSMVPN
jgi:hypothetical protein